ncbi:MAG: GldG family protein, partial [Clostridia bacterium]|nr:GldG family protein [Clostridia bacterium]
SKRIMRGAFSVTSIVLSIALAFGINFGLSKIPEQYTVFDVTPQNIYSITDQTKAILKNLQSDITIYVLAGKDTQDTTIGSTLEQYESLSKHIKVEFKDPTQFPTFTAKYSSDAPTANSLIIESEKRYTIIDYNDMFLSELDPSTYQQTITGYDGEGKITSAIDYVTSDTLPKMYVIAGHNELDMPAGLISQIGKENIETETISLVKLDAIPEDAGCIMIIAPTTDFSADDTKKILTYMKNGGSAVIFSTYTDQPMDNFNALLKEYGCSMINGIIADADSDHANQNPFYLLPDILTSEITSSLYGNSRYVFIPYAHGIALEENVRDSLNVSEILKTSDKSYSKEDPNTQVLKQEEQDPSGPFAVGIYATEEVNDKTTHLLYVSSEYMVNSEANAAVSGTNYELIMNALGKMVSHEVTVSIPAKEYNAASLIINTSSFLLWCVLTIFVIPFAILILGIVIWLNRRKK